MIRTLFILVIIAFSLAGCRDDMFYSHSYEIEDYKWATDDVKEFTFSITDTSKVYMWFVDIRHTADFEFSNFYIFPRRISPNGKTYTDTLNVPLADPSGKWYGKGLGDILDNRILWKKDVKFPQEGNYVFRLEQGSREAELEGIVNIGFSMYEYE